MPFTPSSPQVISGSVSGANFVILYSAKINQATIGSFYEQFLKVDLGEYARVNDSIFLYQSASSGTLVPLSLLLAGQSLENLREQYSTFLLNGATKPITYQLSLPSGRFALVELPQSSVTDIFSVIASPADVYTQVMVHYSTRNWSGAGFDMGDPTNASSYD